MLTRSLSGVLAVDKPVGISSYDVIRRVRELLPKPEPAAGHAGTLDPFATGVLLVLLGDATKLSNLLMQQPKEYVARAKLGVRTDTDDITGRVVEERAVPALDPATVRETLARFTGTIEQTPPAFSALKQGGERSYDLARKGEPVAPKSRRVTVHSLVLVELNPPEMTFRCTVSSGTYVRALGRDIGSGLGTCATLSELRRTRSGRFRAEQAARLDALAAENIASLLCPCEDSLPELARVEVTAEAARSLVQGRLVPWPSAPAGDGRFFALTADRTFLALASNKDGRLHADRVVYNHAAV